MGNGNCAVIGCFNNSKKLNKWKNSKCDVAGHEMLTRKDCGCTASNPPFTLWMFHSDGSVSGKQKM